MRQQPVIDTLVTLINKIIWKFTSFLIEQVKATLGELDAFLRAIEPDIEKITGEERDTHTFMKIMRMFNELFAKQQEMEVKFELMRNTIKLIKKYNRFDVSDLEASFNLTPLRWTNLKSKVTLAKQRLGPTIQEEGRLITNDLRDFLAITNALIDEISQSELFDRHCDWTHAIDLCHHYSAKFDALKNKADDLRQLQEFLDTKVLDFDTFFESKKTVFYLEQTWKLIRFVSKMN